MAFVVDRWAARLSAILLRGNAATIRAAGYSAGAPPPSGDALPGLACCIPEGDSAFELLVQ